jgi:1-acyl-sn-glycerol-3-phosphate acyltransferase
MVWLRALIFNLLLFGWTTLVGSLALPLLLLPRRVVIRFSRLWSLGSVVLLRHIVGLDHRIRGRDRLPQGACIIAMKHQSAWDALILPMVLDDPAIVVKRELVLLPIYGWYMWRSGLAIAIDRGAGPAAVRSMVKAAKEAAAAGRPIVIFPQGTRVAPGAHLPYQPGVAALYQALALPLVPAAVNSGLFWGRRAFLKRPGRIVLEFLDPIPSGWQRQRLMAELERRIEAATMALQAEAVEPRPLPAKRSGWAAGWSAVKSCGRLRSNRDHAADA